MHKILIYGIGNPFRCDDAVGIKVAEEVKKRIINPDVSVTYGSIDGLAILDEILGYEKVLFIDSVKTRHGIPGEVYRIPLHPFKSTPPPSVSHGIDFMTALKLAKKFGYKMPKQIDILAIEIEDNTSFSEECTQAVRESIPIVVDSIVREIEETNKHEDRKDT